LIKQKNSAAVPTVLRPKALVCQDLATHEEPVEIAPERPLTIFLNDRELVTLLTDFSFPRELALGFLHNEGLVDRMAQVRAVQIDERQGEARVQADIPEKLIQAVYGKRLVTSGCGKGSIFYHVLDAVKTGRMRIESDLRFPLSALYERAADLAHGSETYRRTRGVHTAALFDPQTIFCLREDIGRHNALDKLAGWLLDHETDSRHIALYTTGRLTSEVMLKAGRIGVPLIVSRSTPTALALQLGEQLGLTAVGALRGRRCIIYLHPERISGTEES